MVTAAPASQLVVPALYRATVSHLRRTPIRNGFRYSTFYWLTDIDDPPSLRRPLRALARFDGHDHDDPRDVLAGAGLTADRILRLAHARSLGHAFNPLTIYWCYRSAALIAIIAEVHNTYGGRHSYLLPPELDTPIAVAKQLYVSPFYPIDGTYLIAVSPPTAHLRVSVSYQLSGHRTFSATLVADRSPLRLATLLRRWVRHPATPLRTSALIRRQGIRLWRRGLPIQPR